jgi:hypothetical protein
MGTLILIENLHKRTTGADLHARIGDFADAEFVSIFRDTSAPAGQYCAYAVMTNDEEADALIDWLDGTSYGGQTISAARSSGPTGRGCGARSLFSWACFLAHTQSRTSEVAPRE